MRTFLFVFIASMLYTTLAAQKREEALDVKFRPVNTRSYYYAVTEKKDTGWYRQVWFTTEKTLAMEGWYKDSVCQVAHGRISQYYPTQVLKSQGNYLDGKKEGPWLDYNEKGRLTDSAFYVKGRQRGTGLGWDDEGYRTDSSYFDSNGNGVQVAWFKEGSVRMSGGWIQDTLRQGRWQYFHENGKLKATEDYVNGKVTQTACFTESGEPLATGECESKEANFPGEAAGWRRFLEETLNADVPARNGAPEGQYTVLLQFIVDKDGSLYEMKSLTRFGYGMEEEIIRVLKKSPKWIPAQQFGRKVKAYRLQPVTFVVYEQKKKKRW